MKSSKGQIFTTDFVLAVTVLLFILVISTASFGLIQNSLNQEESYSEMQEKALTASEALVSGKGDPELWEALPEFLLDSIGIADERNVLDEKKIDRLIELYPDKYDEIKNILGLQKYDFYFTVNEMDHTEIKAFGQNPEGKEKIVIQRYVLLNGKTSLLELGVYK